MLKRDELEQPNSCINKAANDEPVFVLRAKDPLAASAVEYWAKNAEATGFHDPAKCAEARHLASSMREWRDLHVSRDRAAAQSEAANRHEG